MALLASDCIARMEHRLHGDLPSSLVPIDVLNEVGRIFFGMREWRFARAGEAFIDFAAGQSYASLPRDCGRILAVDEANARTRRFKLVPPEVINEARSLDPSPSSYCTLGAYTWANAPAGNLFRSSSDLGNATYWKLLNATLLDGEPRPDGRLQGWSVTDLATGTGTIYQDVAADDLIPGTRYCFSWFVARKVVADVSRLLLNWGVQAWADFQWDASNVATLKGTGSSRLADPTTVSAGVVDDPVLDATSVYRCYVSAVYDPVPYLPGLSAGGMRCELQPTGGGGSSGLGALYVWGPQINEGATPTPYASTDTGDIVPQTRPQPLLDLYPTPTETRSQALRVRYQRCWADVRNDGDAVLIPEWCEPLFLALCEEYADGLDAHEVATTSERLQGVKASELWHGAVRHDTHYSMGAREGNGTAMQYLAPSYPINSYPLGSVEQT